VREAKKEGGCDGSVLLLVTSVRGPRSSDNRTRWQWGSNRLRQICCRSGTAVMCLCQVDADDNLAWTRSARHSFKRWQSMDRQHCIRGRAHLLGQLLSTYSSSITMSGWAPSTYLLSVPSSNLERLGKLDHIPVHCSSATTYQHLLCHRRLQALLPLV